MSPLAVLVITVLCIALAMYLNAEDGPLPTSKQARAERALKRHGITGEVFNRTGAPVNGERVELPFGIMSPDEEYEFTGVDEHGHQQTGIVRVTSHGAEVLIDGGSAQQTRAKFAEKAAREDGAADGTLGDDGRDGIPDTQTLIDREVALRLDQIQGVRGAFLANDINGDGVVDANEWELARARIRREVEEEFARNPSPRATAAPQHAPIHADPDLVPAPTVENAEKFEFEIDIDFDIDVDEEQPVTDEVW